MLHTIDEWELFDLKTDPMEPMSVYNDPAYREVRDSLHVGLQKLRDRYGDSDALAQRYIQEDLENPRFLLMMQWMLSKDPPYDLPDEVKARLDSMTFNPGRLMPGNDDEEE
jgi:hypothetical protein